MVICYSLKYHHIRASTYKGGGVGGRDIKIQSIKQ